MVDLELSLLTLGPVSSRSKAVYKQYYGYFQMYRRRLGVRALLGKECSLATCSCMSVAEGGRLEGKSTNMLVL